VELGLLDVESSPPLTVILNSTNFPQLKALAWFCSKGTVDLGTVPNGFVEQLEVISIDANNVAKWSTDFSSRVAMKTLFDINYNDAKISLPPVPSLRIVGFEERVHPDYRIKQKLSSLAFFLSNSSWDVLPSLLYLPSWLRPYYYDNATHSPQELNFQGECEECMIEVVFEEETVDFEKDSAVSVDFWRRMKARQKEAKALKRGTGR